MGNSVEMYAKYVVLRSRIDSVLELANELASKKGQGSHSDEWTEFQVYQRELQQFVDFVNEKVRKYRDQAALHIDNPPQVLSVYTHPTNSVFLSNHESNAELNSMMANLQRDTGERD